MRTNWTETAARHSLRYRMEDGLFVSGLCAYCGLNTIDFCPECGLFVCRQCDIPEHWRRLGIRPDFGFVVEPFDFKRRGRR